MNRAFLFILTALASLVRNPQNGPDQPGVDTCLTNMEFQAAAWWTEEERWANVAEDTNDYVSARRTIVVEDCPNMIY